MGMVGGMSVRARAIEAAFVMGLVVLVALMGSTGIASAKPSSGTGPWPGKRADLSPAARHAIERAEAHRGLPSGAKVPDWATKDGRHPYFLPSLHALKKSKRLARKTQGAADPIQPGGGPGGGPLGAPEGSGEFGGHQGGTNELGLRCTGSYCPAPPLRFMGGIAQTAPKVRVVFWGSNWNNPANLAGKALISKLFEGMSGSAYQGILTQYFGAEGGFISPNIEYSIATDTRVTAPQGVGYESFAEEADWAAVNFGWPQSLNTQYVLITAPGTTYQSEFTGFCAYHTYDEASPIWHVYSVVPYAGDAPFGTENGCSGYYGGGDAMKATSVMASHEYAEAVTDPFWDYLPGWLDYEGYEIGDICATPVDELPSGAFAQGEYDNHQNACSLGDSSPPHVMALTETANPVGKTTATLRATVNPEKQATTYRFEWGPTAEYGNVIGEGSAGSSFSDVAVSANLSGLEFGHVYHYRVRATNASGTTYGEDRTFVTSPWTVYAPSEPAHTAAAWVNDISCVYRGDCMAVGHSYNVNVEPWNLLVSYEQLGSNWSYKPISIPKEWQFSELSGVSCSAVIYCTAVGHTQIGTTVYPIALRWNGLNGGSWTAQTVPAPSGTYAELADVSCVSSTECIAVGYFKNAGGVFVDYSARWNGTSWSTLSTPNPEGIEQSLLEDISCSGANACTAAGWYNPASGGSAQKVIMRWNGSSWSMQGAAESTGILSGVSCPTSNSCTAVGGWGTSIERWDGSKWTSQETPPLPEADGGYLESVSCPSTEHCLAVGSAYGKQSGAPYSLAMTGSGDSWALEPIQREHELAKNYLSAVSCGTEYSCGAAGFTVASAPLGSPLLESKPGYQPFVKNEPATKAGAKNVDLRGWINPSEHETTYKFEWGTTNEYGNTTAVKNIGTKTGSVSATIGGIEGSTTYHYRLAATNDEGTSYTPDETFKFKWTPTISIESPSVTAEGAILRAIVNPESFSTTYRFEYGKTTSYGTNVPAPDANVGSGTSGVNVSQGVSLRPERVYHYRIVATNAEGSTTSADQVFITKAITPSYLSSFGAKGTGNGQLQRPLGIARDSSGNFWVADADNNRIQKFNAKGEYLSQFGTKGTGNGQLTEPRDIAFTASGNLWVTDAGNGRIQEFTPQGAYIQQAGISEGSPFKEDKLVQPYGVAIDSQGRIWVTDSGNNKVVQFSENVTNGTHFVASYKPGVGQPGLEYPSGIAVDSQGTIWFTDTTNNKVYKIVYDSGWKAFVLETAFGTAGTGAGQLSEPRGIIVKPSGNLAIAEKANNRVQIFSPGGEYLGGFGTKGSGSGQMLEPRSLVQGAGGVTYVTDAGNSRIQKWSQPWEPEATTTAATSMSSSGATLNGTVTPSGIATTYRFEYGKTTSYGSSAPVPDASAGSGTEAVAVSKAVSLAAETLYHYRIVATNPEGTAYGVDKTFTTAVPMTAFQANDGYLWVYSPTLGANNTALGMKASTSPSATTLSDGTHQVAFQDNQGNLWLYSPTTGASNTGLGMAAGTSPSIIALPGGGYVVAFQANDGKIWTYSPVSGSKNTGQSIMLGTSPSIAAMPDGTYRVAYGALNTELCIYSSATGQSSCNGNATYGNVAIAPTPSGSYTVAFRNISNNLAIYTPSTTNNTTYAMKSGTGPGIVALSDGSYRIAYQASNGELTIYTSVGGGKAATGQAMLAGTSPSIAVPPTGGYEAAFQAASTSLKIYSSPSGSTQDTGLGMMSATGPGIG